MATVRWSLNALDDLRAISAFLDRISPLLATKFETRMLDSADGLRDFPSSGRLVPERQTTDVRELIVAPYRLVYRLVLDDDRVDILRILHSRQDFRRILDDHLGA